MLNYIVELAAQDGVLVPDAEDNIMDSGFNRTKSTIFSKFWAWYAGDEESNPQKGTGVPTVARVLLAERLERPLVDKDFTVAESLFALPQFHTLQASIQSSAHLRIDRSTSDESEAPHSPHEDDTLISSDGIDELLGSLKRRNEEADYTFSELVKAYEQAVYTASGSVIRAALYRRQLEFILASRRIGVLKFFWPPVNSNRLCQRFMFPRIGLLQPPFSIPEKRYKLFASRENHGYTLADVMSWCFVNDDDDELLCQAELEGQKKEAYVAWVMRANDRLVEGRQLMEDEDKRSFLMRFYLAREEKSIIDFPYSGQLDIDSDEYHKLYLEISPQWCVNYAAYYICLDCTSGCMEVVS